MRKRFLFLLISAVIIGASARSELSQNVIKNPEKPKANNAGRAVPLKEIWRITDASGEFYFKRPLRLKTASDGSIFIADEYELLKFSPDGKFVANLLKKGEGPGETTQSYLTFTLSGHHLYAFSYPDKFMLFDLDGKLIKDSKVQSRNSYGIIGIFGNCVYLCDSKQPDPKTMNESKLYDYRNVIIALDYEEMKEAPVTEFPQRFWFGRSGSSSQFYMIWDPFVFAIDEKTGKLAVSNSCDYIIHLADLASGKLDRSFNRKYQKIRIEIKESLKEWRIKTGAPIKEFSNDVLGVYFHDNLIWAVTSTKDDKKGVLFDVFNEKGEYVDCFYLKFSGQAMNVVDDHVFVQQENADGEISIVKYLIGK